ncbi:MAG: FecR domain-containing protein [Verrucomicrobiales bacterium]|nr:FecR domain-containing protein [Verrucomicrobiales bacterium]
MKDPELQDWIDRSLNGTAKESDARALEKRLLEDERARAHYLNEVNLHASLRRRFSAAGDCPAIPVIPAHSRRRLILGLAAAASVALAVGVISLLSPSPEPTAVIAHVVGAYDKAGAEYVAGESVEPGRFDLSKGLVRLDFSNGARVSVEGPAEVEVVDEMGVILHRGVVTATIPESAVGFVVDTPAAHVVDLGTSFGVSVSETGLTDVCVFDGEVEVSSGHRSADTAPHLLKEGDAVRAGREASLIESVVYDSSPFENTWPVNSGVLQTTGSMRFVSPGPDFHPGNYEDNEHIVVFPERRGFLPSGPTRVDMVDPGQYAKTLHEDKPILLPEQRLTSYLLQLNAYPEGENPLRRRSVRGQITFAKPIVGVVMANRLLKESEEVFGIPGVKYPVARMIEARPEGDPRKGFDTVILAADRRTLIIELQENPGNLDQFRVLVGAE